jgi:molybdopterin molybdotransferase
MDFLLPSYEQAARVIAAFAAREILRPPSIERVELGLALGRVLAKPLVADADQPSFNRSLRDGFACRASEASAHVALCIAGSTRAGEPPVGVLPANAAWEIMTGAPIPAGADAVAMVEHVEHTSGGIRLLPPRTLVPGENIVDRGAQARAGDTLLHTGTSLGFAQIALAAACGFTYLNVFRRPSVAILTTGDELVPIEATPGPGQIRNSNAAMLAAMVATTGGDPWILPASADNAQSLDAALREAVKADLLLLSGGVSAGKFDLVESALSRAGANFHFTGVRIQPGKPLVFGELPRDADSDSPILPFFGLPGNPASSAITFLLFAAPVLSALAGHSYHGPRFALARLGTQIAYKAGLTRFLPASCNFCASIDSLPEVVLIPWKGSGDLAAMARSNCFLVVPEESLEAGAVVRVLLL